MASKVVPAEELRALHDRVAAIWFAERKHLFGGACGYSILGSRPTLRPRLMVIGANPGFSVEDAKGEAHIHNEWPEGSYLDGETWPLKERLREIFSKANASDVMQEAVVTNFNFFKSGSQTRETKHCWSELDKNVRHRVEQACLNELRWLVQVVAPQEIMVLGMDAFDRRVEPSGDEPIRRGDRRLVGTGRLWNVPTFAIMHPSGARWSEGDKQIVTEWLKNHFAASKGGSL